MFDKAFEKLHRDKASRDELEMLRLSVDESRAKSIFNDMKELFDVSIKEIQKQQGLEKQKMKEAFQYVLEQGKEKAEKDDLSFFMFRIEKLEQLVNKMAEEKMKDNEIGTNERTMLRLSQQDDELKYTRHFVD